MYAKRIKIVNYGPIEKVDIEFPFDEVGDPKPVLLVGENGSGKTILLSHIVNGLVVYKDDLYRKTPEVKPRTVYKVRSNSYIRHGHQFYYSSIRYERNLQIDEMMLMHQKKKYNTPPMDDNEYDIKNIWGKIKDDESDYFGYDIFRSLMIDGQKHNDKVKDIISNNCILYFPSNRFEEPAWLNEDSLKSQAKLTKINRMEGHTIRKIINNTPLQDNQDWLFDVLYDCNAFEAIAALNPDNDRATPEIMMAGEATYAYQTALQVARHVMKKNKFSWFKIGRRYNRYISLRSTPFGPVIPNIFQLSSGEISLLNIFLSVLRDFDLCDTPFESAELVRGIVLVDEIDLHLHANHQSEVLPQLIKMFPKVQFIVTTHSPLFVLGMRKLFGEDGFGLYRLPDGQQIGSEEFSEFEDAYRAITDTNKFLNHIQTEIEKAQQPVVCMEGKTDVQYLEKAAELLDRSAILDGVTLLDAGGSPKLDAIWKNLPEGFAKQKVILIYDCDVRNKIDCDKKNLFRRIIPKKDGHPLEKGIENLFGNATLEQARSHKKAFIDIEKSHEKTIRGETQKVPEKWEVNENEKTNLCNWLCENGTDKDFKHFAKVFDLLEEILEPGDEADQTAQ